MFRPNVDFSLDLITPEKASEFLATRNNQRNLREKVVRKYADLMRSGKWMYAGDTVVFDENGHLVQGQHRCTAAVRSGVGFWAIVVKGIKTEAIMAIDDLASRLAADNLKSRGHTNCHALAACARMTLMWRSGSWPFNNNKIFGHIEIIDIVETDPAIADAVKESISLTWFNKRIEGRNLSFMIWATRQTEVDATSFWRRINKGTELSETEVAYVLRNKLDVKQSRKDRWHPVYELAVLTKAWNTHVLGESIKKIVFTPDRGEQYPRILKSPNEYLDF